MKSVAKSGLKVRSMVKAGGMTTVNHNHAGLKVRSAVKAGGMTTVNHNRAGLRVRSAVKAGAHPLAINHSRRLLG